MGILKWFYYGPHKRPIKRHIKKIFNIFFKYLLWCLLKR